MKKRLGALSAAALMLIVLLLPLGGAGAAGMSYQPTQYYAASEYCNRLKAIPLTGDRAFDIINVASSQIGYHEGDSVSELGGGNTRGKSNYSEYGYWFGTKIMGYEDGLWSAWCAFFISWCARQANVPESVVCNAAYAKPDGYSSIGFGYFHVDEISPRGFTPRSGDLIFFDWDCDVTWDHVGLVYYVDGGRVATIEGNADDGALLRVYDLSDPVIRAYGRPKYGDIQQAHAELIAAKGMAQRALRVRLDGIAAILHRVPEE